MSVDSVALALVFDPEALESLTGAARAGHLRFKPSTGLTAALLDADGAPTGWLRVLADGEEKLDNARRRAQRRSLTVEATALPERVACEERAARHDEGAPQPAQQANHSGAGTGDAAGALPRTITAFWGPDWPSEIVVVAAATPDQFAAIGGGDVHTAATTAEQIMFAPDADAMSALEQMNRTQSSRLLVVQGDKLLGIVTLKDLLRFLSLKLELEVGDKSSVSRPQAMDENMEDDLHGKDAA